MSDSDKLAYAMGGIVVAGLLYLVLALLFKLVGAQKVMRFFPPIVTGPIIILIGLNLSGTAVSNASTCWWLALVAIAIIIVANIWGKGMVKIIPILLGVVGSYLVALVATLCGAQLPDANGVMQPLINFSAMKSASVVGLQQFVLAKFDLTAILVMAPIAIAAMMEHIGDISAISSTTGRNFIADPGLHRTLLGDGLATALAGAFGGPANTTYGENTGVLALSKVYDPRVVRLAAVYAIILSFSPKFDALVNSIPTAIVGGVSFILYGMISAVGVRNVVENRVDLTKSRNLIIAAVIFVCGLGFQRHRRHHLHRGQCQHHPDGSGHRRSGGCDPQRRSPRQRLSVRHRSRGRQVPPTWAPIDPHLFPYGTGPERDTAPALCRIFLIAAFPWAASACRPDGSGSRYRTPSCRAMATPSTHKTPLGRQDGRQRHTDAPHGAEIQQHRHQRTAGPLKHAAGHDGGPEQRLHECLDPQYSHAQLNDGLVHRHHADHGRGQHIQQRPRDHHHAHAQRNRQPAQPIGQILPPGAYALAHQRGGRRLHAKGGHIAETLRRYGEGVGRRGDDAQRGHDGGGHHPGGGKNGALAHDGSRDRQAALQLCRRKPCLFAPPQVQLRRPHQQDIGQHHRNDHLRQRRSHGGTQNPQTEARQRHPSTRSVPLGKMRKALNTTSSRHITTMQMPGVSCCPPNAAVRRRGYSAA